MSVKSAAAFLLAASCAAFAASAQQPARPVLKALSPEVQAHIAAAKKLAGNDLPKSTIGEAFNTSRGMAAEGVLPPADHPMGGPYIPLEPTKAFDQLAYVGGAFVGVWALDTTGGIIMWDAMDNVDEAEHIVEPGLKQLGLDPARIKYIILTHGHGDHFGGAPYFKKKYPGLHILASAGDWDVMKRTAAAVAAMPQTQALRFGPPPEHDMDVTDGQKLTLGATTVTLYVTPGHTLGPVSAVFSVTDHGQPHVVGLFGGFGLPPGLKGGPADAGLDTYDTELARFQKTASAAGADVVMSTHPGFDGTEEHIPQMKARKAGDPNPWVVGREGFTRFMNEMLEISHAKRAMIEQQNKAALTN